MARDRLGDLLIRAGLLDQEGLQRALNEQKRWGGLLGHYLVELRLISEENLVRALSTQYRMPAVALDPPKLDVSVGRLVPQRICERHRLVCFRADEKTRFVDVAVANPANIDALEEVRVATRCNVRPHIAGPRSIDQAITFIFYGELPLGAEIDLSPASGLRHDLPQQAPTRAPHLELRGGRRSAPTRELAMPDHVRPPTDEFSHAARPERATREAPMLIREHPEMPRQPPHTERDSGVHITFDDVPALESVALPERTTVEERIAYLEAVVARDSAILEALLNRLVHTGVLSRGEAEQLVRAPVAELS